MKALIVSIILFTVVITTSVIHCVYLERLTDNILKIIDNLPSDISAKENALDEIRAIENLIEIWEKNSKILSASINNKYISTITSSVQSLKQYYISQEEPEYLATLATLKSSVINLKNSESLSLLGIF